MCAAPPPFPPAWMEVLMSSRPFLDPLARPVAGDERPAWGSDIVVAMLRRLGVEYAAITPGSSFRGLHDSLVNFGGNVDPGLIICNHEEVAVAVAHGYAKARGRPMAAIVHSNVGLMHATMAIFNAWADRQPVLVLGATGPLDSRLRRPWIDWIHTANGQGQLVREYTKWESQPASLGAIPEAMLRAWRTMLIEPRGPVYLCLDATLQEQPLDDTSPVDLPDVARYPLPAPPPPPSDAVVAAARLLVSAERPVLLVGRATRTDDGWSEVVELAELLGAAVLTDLKSEASFPTNHPLHQAWPTTQGDETSREVVGQADVIMALEWTDPAGTVRGGPAAVAERHNQSSATRPRLINVSLNEYAVRSWAADHQELPPADLPILSTATQTIGALLPEVRRLLKDDWSARGRADRRWEAHRARRVALEARWAAAREAVWAATPIRMTRLLGELATALGERRFQVTLVRVPLAWPAGVWDFAQPGAYLGNDGGAGVGSGPGMGVGAALGLQGTGRLPIAILGDGDMLMAPSALWTAAHHRIPILLIVANNQTYFNDEQHQERVARARARPVDNKWLGQRMDAPAVDFAALGHALGVEGIGPVTAPDDLAEAYRRAVRAVDEGRPVLVDVRIAS
jgi:thiamine pyrophosphate-dependent acetolactate synthase large subunit-like protein